MEQPRKGSVNEDHFANNQWGSLMQTTNQKWARNAIKTSDMALLLIAGAAAATQKWRDLINIHNFDCTTKTVVSDQQVSKTVHD